MCRPYVVYDSVKKEEVSRFYSRDAAVLCKEMFEGIDRDIKKFVENRYEVSVKEV